MHSAYPLVPECPEELHEGHAEAAGLQRNTEGMICAQVPVLAAQPSGLTVLPIQPTASLLTQPSAQLQERPEDVRVPCVAWLVSWSGCMPHGNLCAVILRSWSLMTLPTESNIHLQELGSEKGPPLACGLACRCRPSVLGASACVT